MAYYPNPFDEDEEERRRRLGLAADTETEESTEPKPMSEMSTREAVAAAYDKQHPYGGTATMTGPLGNISYYDEELNKPKIINTSQANNKEASYELGTLSGRNESNNNYCAIGGDKSGGYSFGKYQIASKPGTMNDYINYLSKNEQYKPYADQLNKSGGNQAAVNGSNSFINKWKEICKDDNFNQTQEKFIFDTHYEPIKIKLNNIPGLNIESRSPVLKDVIFSSAVQHRNNTPNIIKNAFNNSPHLAQMSDEDIIKGIYNERKNINKYFTKSSPAEQNAIQQRMEREKEEALRLLKLYR